LKKIGPENVVKELQERGFSEDTLKKVQDAQMPDSLQTIIKDAAQLGVDKSKIVFEPTLARGLDYYTGLIFEVEIPAYTVGSVCGGGRYDKLLGLFTKDAIPAVGFAFGFDRIMEAMAQHDLFPTELKATATVLVTIFNPDLAEQSLKIGKVLREAGIKAEIWLDAQSKMEKQLKYANSKQIPYVVVVGPNEADQNLLTLKNMQTREQSQMSLEAAVRVLTA
jgi:histidyl-tRNA synthetase